MNNLTPIIFIHKGYSDYLYYSLKQAISSNPNTNIYIIGDESNDRFNFIRHVLIQNYSQKAKLFENIYKHYSTNGYQFELFCFQRWFILSEFMEKEKVDNIFICDSDLMIYCDISKLNEKLRDYTASYCFPEYQDNYRWSASAHNSFWTTSAINSFCAFILEIYSTDKIKILEEKWSYYTLNRISGGICDMTLLYLFEREKGDRVCNLLKVTDGSVFDDNINSSENYLKNEYRMKNNKKDIVWKNGSPYCYNTILNKEVRFLTLHFQGSSGKQVIHKGYKGNDCKVKIKSFLRDIKFLFNRAMNLGISLVPAQWKNLIKKLIKIA